MPIIIALIIYFGICIGLFGICGIREWIAEKQDTIERRRHVDYTRYTNAQMLNAWKIKQEKLRNRAKY